MSDHTTQGGVDWELRQAEEAMVAAPDGTPALARAMRPQATKAQLARLCKAGVLVETEKHYYQVRA